jgi:CelD/BcsL family acetyltransferase involved in cellulose biosynthesis
VAKCAADSAEIARTLAEAFVLMEQAPGDKGEAIRKTVRPLLEKAAPAMIAAGRLWLHTLYVEDSPAAVTIQFPHHDGPQLYNCGFDAAKKEWSPGVVLTFLIIKEAIESGAREFDLLRGQEPYKYRLGARDRGLWMVTLRRI